MKLPDVGEGVAEAEIVEWLVEIGDEVTPDSPLAEVLTDKATVEISPPVAGVIVALHGEPGDVLAVGSELVEIDTGGSADHEAADPAATDPNTPDGIDEIAAPDDEDEQEDRDEDDEDVSEPVRKGGAPSLAAPAVRRRADDLGIDLATVDGSGQDGRVVHADLDRMLVRSSGATARPSAPRAGGVERVRGVRRRIAERLTAAWTEIPHITYVDAIDVTELERLRTEMNADIDGDRLTILAFLGRAIVLACRDQPSLNAHYDHEASELTVFDDVRLGIATQTDSGLMVPVVRGAEQRSIPDLASEVARVTSAARDGSASRDELSGSTITITSLGALGGIATTPILNPPEVAIIGVNKIEVRPTWADGVVVPRQMMNLSSSFDHRMVDGWDAATFVQRIRRLIETPALLFVDRPARRPSG